MAVPVVERGEVCEDVTAEHGPSWLKREALGKWRPSGSAGRLTGG